MKQEDIYFEYIKLLEINNNLKKENERLQNLLRFHNINYEEDMSPSLTKKQKIEIYLSYFKGRKDVIASKYYKNDKKAYAICCANRFINGICNYKCNECKNKAYISYDEDRLLEHFKGKDSYGIYPLLEDNTCYFIVLDFDNLDYEFKETKEMVQALKKVCLKHNITPLLELSQSGNGIHFWIFFAEAVEAKKARKFADYLLLLAMDENSSISYKTFDRMFPNQDYIKNDGYGNLIALPLDGKLVKDGKSVFIDDDFKPYFNQIECLKSINKLSLIELDLLLKEAKDKSIEFDNKKNKLKITDFPNLFTILISDDIYISKNDLSAKIIRFIKSFGIISNPLFYEKERKRQSVYGINRIIELYKEDDDYISLPRGTIDDLLNALNMIKVRYKIIDKLELGERIHFKCNALLKDYQIKAVEEMLKYNNGLLVAPTGSGKTVMALAIIAKKQLRTAIIVDSLKLLNQWEERINSFLELENGELEVGKYYGSKKKISKIIDILSIDSLIKTNDNIFSYYDLVIVDEAHHMASIKYEDVIRKFKTKYIYGLTATPKRSDNLEKIVYKSIGNIRHVIELNKNQFEKVVMPIFTNFKLKENTTDFNLILDEIIRDISRNLLIINKVKEEYEKGRNILILTRRVEHIDILYNLLIDKCHNIYRVSGTSSKEEKEGFNKFIKEVKEKFIIISTGNYLGEGFDMPNLNSLFIATPVKFEGLQKQYIGRIERIVDGKEEVKVFDLVDSKVFILLNMFQVRLRTYKKQKYEVINTEKNKIIYDHTNYLEKLKDDIINANEVIFSIKYGNLNVIDYLLNLNNNVKIISDLDIKDVTNKVNVRFNYIKIDNKIIWYGDINPFVSLNKESTSILRITDLDYIREIEEMNVET